MVLEHLYESLVLLRRKFCWSLHDILHLHLFASQNYFKKKSYKTEANQALLQRHQEWSPVDYALYEHFAAKLKKEIEDGGKDLQAEVENFHRVNQDVANFCTSSCDTFDQIIKEDLSVSEARTLLSYALVVEQTKWNPRFEVSGQNCFDMLAQQWYTKAIKSNQWKGWCKTCPKSCNVDMIGNFCLTVLKRSGYFTKKTCVRSVEV